MKSFLRQKCCKNASSVNTLLKQSQTNHRISFRNIPSFREKALWAFRISSLEPIASPFRDGGKLMVKDWKSDKVCPSSSGFNPAFKTTLRMAWVAHCGNFITITRAMSVGLVCQSSHKQCQNLLHWSWFGGQKKDWEGYLRHWAVLGWKHHQFCCWMDFPIWIGKWAHTLFQ